MLATTARSREMTQQIYTATEGADVLHTITMNEMINSNEEEDGSDNSGSSGSGSSDSSNPMSPRVGVLYGRETHGLTNKEISCANGVICIDAFDGYAVLNLAQAVNIVSYEIWKKFSNFNKKDNDHCSTTSGITDSSGGGNDDSDSSTDSVSDSVTGRLSTGSLATTAEVNNLLTRLEDALILRNYKTARSEISSPDKREQVRERDYREIRSTVRRNRLTKKEVRTWHGILSNLIEKKKNDGDISSSD